MHSLSYDDCIQMSKKMLLGILFLLILFTAGFLYKQSLSESIYLGIPTVPCQDYTQPIRQQFTFSLSIHINGQPYPLDANIGHDFGKCLHALYTNDTSGKVYVAANDTNTYTLGQFFDVWRKTFNDAQIMQYPLTTKDTVEIFVNGQKVTTGRSTPLLPNEKIELIYE